MAQQTAVSWLHLKLQETYDKEGNLPLAYTLYLVEQAKEMEKEQLKDAYWNGTLDMEKEDAMSEAEDFYNAYYSK